MYASGKLACARAIADNLRVLADEAWAESARLAQICDNSQGAERDRAVKDWQAAFIKAGVASRLYHATWATEEVKP